MTLEGIEDGGRRADGAPSGPIDVLHVDDEQSQVELAVEFFERAEAEFAVRTATSPDDALEELAETHVDCVISDYQMPGMDGLEFFEAVREEYPDVPLVLFTGKGSEEVASRAISLGVAEYIEKEVGTAQYDRLARRVREIVAGDERASGRSAGGAGPGSESGPDSAADAGAGTEAAPDDDSDAVSEGLTAEIAGEEGAAGAEPGPGAGGGRPEPGEGSAPTGGPLDEAQYERLLDGLPGGTYVVRDGSFVYTNATFAQTVGYQPEQLTDGMGMADLCNEVRSEIQDRRPEDQDEGIVTYQVSGERAIGGEFTLGIRERREELDGESVVIGLALDLSD